MNYACFYIVNDEGVFVDDELVIQATNGKFPYNEFSTFNQALKVAQKVSRKNEGIFSITVCINTVNCINGEIIDV